MATVFWDTRGTIFIDYLQKSKIINGEYYANLLQRLSDEVKRKRPHLAKKKSCFTMTLHQHIRQSSRGLKSTN